MTGHLRALDAGDDDGREAGVGVGAQQQTLPHRHGAGNHRARHHRPDAAHLERLIHLRAIRRCRAWLEWAANYPEPDTGDAGPRPPKASSTRASKRTDDTVKLCASLRVEGLAEMHPFCLACCLQDDTPAQPHRIGKLCIGGTTEHSTIDRACLSDGAQTNLKMRGLSGRLPRQSPRALAAQLRPSQFRSARAAVRGAGGRRRRRGRRAGKG